MTVHWTDRDPGAGDTAAFATAIAWADAQLVDLANAQDVVSTILRDLDDAWSGRAAGAFRTRLEEFHSRLDDSTDAMTTARKSIITYRDAVAEISRLAEPLKEELAASQAALSGVMNDASFGGEPGDRFAAEQEARAAASTAATALKNSQSTVKRLIVTSRFRLRRRPHSGGVIWIAPPIRFLEPEETRRMTG